MSEQNKTNSRPDGDEKREKSGQAKLAAAEKQAPHDKSKKNTKKVQNSTTTSVNEKTHASTSKGTDGHQRKSIPSKDLDIILNAISKVQRKVEENSSNIRKQQEAMDSWYEYDCNDEHEEEQFDPNIGDVNIENDGENEPSTSASAAGSSENDAPPPKKQKVGDDETSACPGTGNSKPDSRFAAALAKYKKSKEKTVEPVADDIAELANESFAQGVDKDKLKTLLDAIHRPENCKYLTEVRVNELIWNLLSQTTKSFDEKLQLIQTSLAKAGVTLVNMLHMIDSPGRLALIDKIIDTGNDGLILLGMAYHLLCLRRRELMRPDVDWRYGHLCSTNIQHSSLLFGDSVEEEIKKIGDTNKVSNTVKGYPYRQYTTRGRARGRFMRGFHRGRGRHGDGSYNFSAQGTRGRAATGARYPRSRPGRRPPSHAPNTSKQGEVSSLSTLTFDLGTESNQEQISLNFNLPLSLHKYSTSVHNQTQASLFKAGELCDHIDEWKKITSDCEILQTVAGCTIEFEGNRVPMQETEPRLYMRNQQENEIISNEIKNLSEKLVIEEVQHEPNEFISNIFLRKKKNGKYRLILNLKEFNENIEYHHFKMETFETALKLISRNCYMASLDIKDAYYCVPVHPHYRKYLRFEWDGKVYQFTCLPNGLACAPRKYTKMMKPVFATLRTKGYIITGYIDDTLIIADSPSDLRQAVQATASLLESLGFTLNYEKSVLEPTQYMQYLGFCIDSQLMRVTLNNEKVNSVIEDCTAMLGKDIDTIRNVSKLIGKIVSSFPAVELGPLHYRVLERNKTWALKQKCGNFDANMEVTHEMKNEIQWWANNLSFQSREIVRKNPDVTITTDASGDGWGAMYCDERIGGRWSMEEKQCHINFLELRAVDLALKSFEDQVKGQHTQLLVDNTTAVAYINNMGGKKKELHELACSIWTWSLNNGMWLSASHIPGVDNVDADYASRHFNDRTEWSLNLEVYEKITSIFGAPEIDLFASRLNKKCARYVSWKRDPEAEYVDAFSRSWQDSYSYLFPPFSLIGRCLQKIQQDQATALMVLPLWPTQSWFTRLLGLLTQDPVLIPQGDNILSLPGSKMLHPLRKKLKMIAVKISGKHSDNSRYLGRLLTSCSVRGKTAPTSNTARTLTDGISFVFKTKLIQCDQKSLKL